MSSTTASPADSPAPGGAATPVNQIDLPLTEVIKKVPDRLKSFVAKIPTETDMASFAASQLMPQLAKGSVKITFAELVEASPEGTFSSAMGAENEQIELPLALVISRLGTGSFQRRSAKKAASVEPQDFFGANRKAEAAATPPETASIPVPATSAPPAAFSPVIPDGPVIAPAEAKPAAPMFAPAVSRKDEPPTAAAPASPPDKAAISLAAILKTLPPDLAACIQGEPPTDATVEFSAAALLPQLAKGKVTVSFAELIDAAPNGLFTNTSGREQTPVPLPLGEVLAKVGPGAFKRKAPSKQLASVGDQKFFGGLAKPIEESAPAPEPAAGETTFSSQTTFQRATPEAAPEEKTLFAPGGGGTPSAPVAPAAPPITPAQPAGQKFEPQPIAPEPRAPSSESPGEAASEVPIPLNDLTTQFPDGLRSEIAKLPAESVVVFPAEELGQAMKSGKIRFAWTQLRLWMLPRSNYAFAAWEGTQVDIPLKAVVGPFMAAMRGQPPKVKIPTSSGADSTPTAPSKPAPAATYQPEPFVANKPTSPQPMPMDGPVGGAPEIPPAPATDSSGTALGELLDQPAKTNWTPVEIVQQVSRLDGVGGAMLSLSEGQVAAAAISVDVKTDLIAFRVPRLLTQVTEHVEQMQLEPANYASFSSAGIQWITFKLGNIFFTVHGRKGENLPVSRLESIAAEVARRK